MFRVILKFIYNIKFIIISISKIPALYCAGIFSLYILYFYVSALLIAFITPKTDA